MLGVEDTQRVKKRWIFSTSIQTSSFHWEKNYLFVIQ